jgi:two-component system response regulator RpaA
LPIGGELDDLQDVVAIARNERKQDSERASA